MSCSLCVKAFTTLHMVVTVGDWNCMSSQADQLKGVFNTHKNQHFAAFLEATEMVDVHVKLLLEAEGIYTW